MNLKHIVRPSLYWSSAFFLFGAIVILCFAQLREVRLFQSDIGKVIRNLENEIDEAARNNQKLVAFLGSSRMHSSIISREFSDYGKWSNRRFVNLAQPSFSAWEIQTVLRNCKQPLSSISVLVIDINAWSFSENSVHPITKKPVFYGYEYPKWATVEERLEVAGYGNKVELMRDYFPKYSIEKYIQILLVDKNTIPELNGPRSHGASDVVQQLADAEDFKAENISRNHMFNFVFSEHKARQFKRLQELCEVSGIRLIVTHPPIRSSYYQYMNTSGRKTVEYQKYLDFIKGAVPEAKLFYWKTADECGLGESVFVGYGHMSKEGAMLYSRMLAKVFYESGVL